MDNAEELLKKGEISSLRFSEFSILYEIFKQLISVYQILLDDNFAKLLISPAEDLLKFEVMCKTDFEWIKYVEMTTELNTTIDNIKRLEHTRF
jgi:hypothetical protein